MIKAEEKAWLELFYVFAGEKEDVIPGRVGILGMTPQDIVICMLQIVSENVLRGRKDSCLLWNGRRTGGCEEGFHVERHIVVSPAALEAAKYLERTYGTPYEIGYPLVDE